MTIPTILTLLRIALIPVFVAVFYLPVSWANLATAALFVVAGVTDWFDGYLARRLNQPSPFGAFLDPVADKLMVAAAQMLALVLLLYRDPIAGLPVMTTGLALLYLAAGLTLWSMVVYLRAAWPMLMSRGNY